LQIRVVVLTSDETAAGAAHGGVSAGGTIDATSASRIVATDGVRIHIMEGLV
jgi:hypothetical protein